MSAVPPAPAGSPGNEPAPTAQPKRRPALKPRPSPAARRFGYLVAAAVNVALWWAIHVWPGWQEVSFLTAETTEVLPWLDVQIAVAVLANVIWLLVDPRWLRALGEAVTALVGIAATARLLTVFPFAFDDDGTAWEPWVRIILVVAIVGAAIGVVTSLIAFARALRTPEDARHP